MHHFTKEKNVAEIVKIKPNLGRLFRSLFCGVEAGKREGKGG